MAAAGSAAAGKAASADTAATHPVNPGRLQSLTVALDRAGGAGLDPDHAEALRFITARVVTLADTLAEPDMQRLIARQAVLGTPADLIRRR